MKVPDWLSGSFDDTKVDTTDSPKEDKTQEEKNKSPAQGDEQKSIKTPPSSVKSQTKPQTNVKDSEKS